MLHTILGCLGFLLMPVLAIRPLRRIAGLKALVWATGSGLIAAAIILAAAQPDKLALPSWSSWLGGILLLLSLPLLICSLYINLPFARTYIRAGGDERLVTGGLYALVRHPWVHAFTIFLVALILLTRSQALFLAAPAWFVVYLAGTFVQDRFLLGRIFCSYADYRRLTPMLVPNRRSITAFISSTLLQLNQKRARYLKEV
jgi:protein-S-isoprenylcysteine O-methyltransferase Ste14